MDLTPFVMFVIIASVFIAILVAAGWFAKHSARKKEAARKRRHQARNVHFGGTVKRSKASSMRHSNTSSVDARPVDAPTSAADPAKDWEADHAVRERERLARERELIGPQLALLESLRSRPSADVSFSDVRHLLVDESTDVDLSEHMSQEESNWLYETYEQLVPIELERLLQGAIDGSEADYHQALSLKDEADDLVSYDIEKSPDLVNKWDRMIMRHVPDPDWDDLLGWDEYHDNSLAVYESALTGDFFSIRLALKLMEEGDEDADIVDRLINDFREKMNEALEAHRSSFRDEQPNV